MPKKANKKVVQKAVSDVDWSGGGTGVSSAFSATAIRAIDKTLSPQDAYALSIDLRAAINARNEPLSHGKIRLFYKRSGDEIIGGELFQMLQNPCPAMSQSAFIYEVGSWWDLAGEMVVGTIMDDKDIPAGIYPLNPFRLTVQTPNPAKTLSSVKQWRYNWENGIQVFYGAESIVLQKNFNPLSSVRGLPPILAGTNEISASYESMAYNRRFFSNNAEPSHIVNLPNVTDPKEIEAFKQEYLSNYSIRTGNSHKVMFVGGSEVRIEAISQAVKEASYLGLQTLTSDKIMRLYKVPPVHGGLWDKAKFDSVGEQNKVFAETVLMPSAERTSQYLQLIVDRFFRIGNHKSITPKHLSKSMKGLFEKASSERPDSDIIVILDIDHLPIISELKSQKLAYAKAFQETFKVSPFEAAEEVGIEIEKNDANQKVWVTSTEQPFIEPTVEPVVETEPTEVPDDSEIPAEDEEITAEKRQQAKAIVRGYRKMVLEKLEQGRVFKLSEADLQNTLGDVTLKMQFRLDYLAIKRLVEAGGDTKAVVKEYLNKTYNRQFYKRVS
jgi:HK97 family phage portal protein